MEVNGGARESPTLFGINDYVNENFSYPGKHASEDARAKWRRLVRIVKNSKRRFRHVSDPGKMSLDDSCRRSFQARIKEKLRVAFIVTGAALRFKDSTSECPLTEEITNAGFRISPDEAALIVSQHNQKSLKMHGGVDGISRKLNVSLENGLDESEVSVRQEIYGINKYTEKPPRSFWAFVWDALQDLTLVVLIVCALVSVAVGLGTEGWPKGMYDGLGIILSILLVVIVTAASDYRQSLQFRQLDIEKNKIYSQVTRSGRRKKVLIYDLVVGDVVHLSIGDQVPADGLFISGYSLSIDTSSLTGESEPLFVSEELPFLLAGTKVQDGSGKMLVTSVGMHTEWGRLMSTLSQGGLDETPLQVKLNGVANIIGQIGLAFAIITFLVLFIRFLVGKAHNGGLSHWSFGDAMTLLDYFATAVTIIVVAVPEGLPLAVTLSLAFAMRKLMDEKALVRHLSACETMGSATCICTDKTGTLTTNHMVVNKIWIGDLSKSFNSDESIAELNTLIPAKSVDILLQGIFENSGSEVVVGTDGKKTVLGTPTEAALLEFCLSLEGDRDAYYEKCRKIKVEPFNSVRKKMSALVSLPGGGRRAFCKGASEIILDICDKIIDGEGNVIPLSEIQAKTVLNVINGFASKALRTLGVAYREVDEGDDSHSIPRDGYTLIAIFGIKDPVRPGVMTAVKTCIAAGITVRMVTGDNINTAKAIAKECGILTDDGIAIEGPEFRKKNSVELKHLIPKIQVIARSSPMDKLMLVSNLKSVFQEVVAVTGDGTNDAPALHESHIGLAMGIAGTEVAKESADILVLDDNFSTIVNVARWGRAVYANIQKFVQFQLTVNIVALIINFSSACIIGRAPLTAVQLLWVNMIMDTLGALALATEPPHDHVMKRPPVRRDENFITRTMWRNIIGQALYQLIVLGTLMLSGKKLLGINGPNSDSTINTLIFNSFVFCQLFNEINSREMDKINIFETIFGNWIFLGILCSTATFQVIIVEFLGAVANTIPLSWKLWIISVIMGAISMPIAAVLKCIPVEAGKAPARPSGYEPIPGGPEDV